MEQHYVSTDFGVFKMVAGKKGLQRLNLVTNEDQIPKDSLDKTPTNPYIIKAQSQLLDYFAGKRETFDVALDFTGATEFYQNVWHQLLKIPYGRTTSYQYIAERLGDKNAIRAVGQANGRNPIAIIVPCHRVIAKSGDLQGYFYGLDFKRKLLALENPKSFGEQGALF